MLYNGVIIKQREKFVKKKPPRRRKFLRGGGQVPICLQVGLQGVHPVGLLPGQVQVVPAKVAIGGQLAIDGAAELQVPDDGAGTQVKGLLHGLLQLGVWETIYMTLLSTGFAYLFGLPMGVILWVTDKNGLPQVGKGKQTACRIINCVLGFVVNFFRSIPCIILMVAMMPVARLILGKSLGNGSVIVTLIIAAAPYIARMVESSVKEVPSGVIEAAQSMGCTNWQIVWHVLLPEAKPSLIHGSVIATVTVLGYTAMAATLGGTGLGQVAIIYGHQRSNADVIWVCVVLIWIVVQVIQFIGELVARKTDKRIR